MNRSTSADHEVPDFEVDRRNISPFVFVAGVAMLAVIAFGVFAVLMQNVDEPKKRSTGLQQQVMPDGTVLVLEDVTFGKRHEFQFERELQSGTLFSGPSLQIDVASTSTPDDAIMLWFSRHDAVTGEALDFEWWSHCIALDEHGCAIEDEKPGRDIYYLDGGHSGMSGAHRPFNPTPSGRRCEKIIVRSSLKPFRHKAKTFKLQVFDAIGTKVAEFDVPNPNPARGSYPVWKPEPLPITKKQGDLEVTLTGLAAFEEEYRSSEGPRQRIRLQPQLRIVEDGKPVNQWLFYGPEIEDALGNTSDSSDCRSCLKETAWKLKFKLFVTDPAMIEPSEQWTVSDLKLLAANKSQMLNKSKTIDGVTVELLAIGGPGRSSYTGLIAQHQKHAQNDTSTITYGKFKAPLSIHFNPGSGLNTTSIDCPLPHVIARLGRSNQDQRVTMQITDYQQRPVKSRTRNIRGVRIWFLFDLAKETKSFNVHFVVQRARKFEFLVKPPEPQKIKPPVRPRPAESPAQRLTRMRGEIQSLQKTLAGNPNNAGTCNRLAWTYVTAPKELQDSKQAVTLAQRAVAGADTWNNRNTWGVAYYRNAEYKRAVEILEGN